MARKRYVEAEEKYAPSVSIRSNRLTTKRLVVYAAMLQNAARSTNGGFPQLCHTSGS